MDKSDIEADMRVRVVADHGTRGMVAGPEWRQHRRVGAVGHIHGAVMVHAGDAWYVRHDDNTSAVYWFDELEPEVTNDDLTELHALLEGRGIRAGQVYRHYMGGLYSIVSLALDKATKETLVVYTSNQTGITWARPLAEFTETIGPPTRMVPVPRFEQESE